MRVFKSSIEGLELVLEAFEVGFLEGCSGLIQTNNLPVLSRSPRIFPALNRDRTLFVAIPSVSVAWLRDIRTSDIWKLSIEGFEMGLEGSKVLARSG